MFIMFDSRTFTIIKKKKTEMAIIAVLTQVQVQFCFQ